MKNNFKNVSGNSLHELQNLMYRIAVEINTFSHVAEHLPATLTTALNEYRESINEEVNGREEQAYNEAEARESRQQFKPHAGITLTNTGCIEIEVHPSGDGVKYRFNYGQDLTTEEILEAEIQYTNPGDGEEEEDGRAYFIHPNSRGAEEGIKYFLDEAMKFDR